MLGLQEGGRTDAGRVADGARDAAVAGKQREGGRQTRALCRAAGLPMGASPLLTAPGHCCRALAQLHEQPHCARQLTQPSSSLPDRSVPTLRAIGRCTQAPAAALFAARCCGLRGCLVPVVPAAGAARQRLQLLLHVAAAAGTQRRVP